MCNELATGRRIIALAAGDSAILKQAIGAILIEAVAKRGNANDLAQAMLVRDPTGELLIDLLAECYRISGHAHLLADLRGLMAGRTLDDDSPDKAEGG